MSKPIPLDPDNSAEWDPLLFERMDNSADPFFYTQPRKVVHIDDGAISAVTQLYRELLPPNGVLLDLMSSWRSHLPSDVTYASVTGLGMNRAEMQDNPQLTAWDIHDLNQTPTLPYTENRFDGICCCVSVQYLQKPVAVFQEVGRVLKRDAPFIITFSNRCFPTKAINLWQYTDDQGHIQIVECYFAASGNFQDIRTKAYIPETSGVGQDPLYAVWGYANS